MRAILLALCMLACTAAHARDYTVEDLLAIESYGQTLIVSRRDLILVEKRGAYAEAADFAYDTYFTSRMVTRIMATSLGRPGSLAPLFPQDGQAGYWIGSLSPGQTRLSVFRLKDRKLTLGVVDLATHAVRWLEPAPDLPGAAPAPVWLGDDHLAYVAMPRPRLPGSLSMGTAGADDVAALWRSQARGEMTRTLVSTRNGAESGNAERRLMIVPLDGGAPRVLATGNIVDMVFSRSHRQVAVVTTGTPVPLPATPINVGFDSRRHHLAIVDVASGRRRDVDGDILPGILPWSADDRLLVAIRHGGSDWQSARWTEIDAAGRTRTLGGRDIYAAIEDAPAARPAYAGWAGASSIALVRKGGSAPSWVRLTATGTADLQLSGTARPVGSTGQTKWMLDRDRLYAVTSSKLRLAVDKVLQAGVTIVDPPSRGYRLAQDPDVLGPVIVDAPTGPAIHRLDERGRSSGSLPMLPAGELLAVDGGRAVVAQRDRRAVTSLTLIGPGRQIRKINRINDRLANVDLPRAIDLKTPGPDGTVLHDWLLLPPRTADKLPLVINLYPGLAYGAAVPREAGIDRHANSDNPLILVGAGYAVMLPSMPLALTGNPIETILPRIDAAADAAVATGLVDGTRIGLQGHSFGAYGAMAVATRSARYKAIVAANGPYDLFATHGAMTVGDKLRFDYGLPAGASIGWTEGGQGGMGAPPAADIGAYAAASPMLHLDQVASPVLLIAGDLDIVDVTQGERAFMELYRHGKDARLARYWGENHTNASPANIRDYWRLTVSFFDEHLKPGPATGETSAIERAGSPTALTPSRH